MEDFVEEYCRLCLSVVKDGHFKEIQAVTKDILDVLLLKLNFEEKSRHVMCNVCSLNVMEAFKFKSMCLYTDNTIIPYVDDEAGCSVDLIKIYVKETGNEQLTAILDEYKVCRLCMHLIKGKFISVHKMEIDMIEKYIPEINFSVVEDSVICRQCFDSFRTHSSFIKNCLEVEERIMSTHKTEVSGNLIWTLSSDLVVKTEEIDIKSEGSEQEEQLLEIYPVSPKLKDKATLNKTENVPIKSDGDKGSDAPMAVPAHDISKVKHSKSTPRTRITKLKQKKNEHRCVKCDYKTLNKNYLAIHQSVHGETPAAQIHKCDTCDYTTIHKSNLARHQIKHKDPSEVVTFKCDTCNYETNCKSSFTEHTLTHKKCSEVQMLKCIYCQYETKSKRGIRRHVLTHERRLLDPKEATKIKRMLQLKKPFSVKKFTCETCDFTTLNKSKFSDHQLRHKGEKPYGCNECEYRALKKNFLKLHMLSHRKPSEVPLYKCDKCDYEVRYKSSLINHQLIHKSTSEIQMNKCLYCDHETKKKAGLKEHIIYCHRSKLFDPEENLRIKHVLKLRKLITVKMYKCDKCDYETVYKRQFLCHQSKHGIVNLRYPCDECSYSTIYKSHLAVHQLSHRKASEVPAYKCDVCFFQTKYKRSLDLHDLKHRNPPKEEMYQCGKCSYASKYKNNLVAHQLKHKGHSEVRTYTCDRCGFKTKRKCELVVHLSKPKRCRGARK
ncbi:zinc finger protein 708-like [Anoplophora glabripennis]|uniref:zinc finger protein 708-like n=1 Tax=Anoplophora glabripennis TaxID=217634 RepID=UPI0008756DC8|nr:zinc finger protein 708-like [Anoplophora glabripennis]